MLFIEISCFFPFLIAFTLELDKIESLSITLLEWISWIVLIAVFIITIPKNSIFLYEPTAKIAIPKSKFKILNNVKKLSIIICFILFVGTEVSKFTCFLSILSWISLSVKPLIISSFI